STRAPERQADSSVRSPGSGSPSDRPGAAIDRRPQDRARPIGRSVGRQMSMHPRSRRRPLAAQPVRLERHQNPKGKEDRVERVGSDRRRVLVSLLRVRKEEPEQAAEKKEPANDRDRYRPAGRPTIVKTHDRETTEKPDKAGEIGERSVARLPDMKVLRL